MNSEWHTHKKEERKCPGDIHEEYQHSEKWQNT